MAQDRLATATVDYPWSSKLFDASTMDGGRIRWNMVNRFGFTNSCTFDELETRNGQIRTLCENITGALNLISYLLTYQWPSRVHQPSRLRQRENGNTSGSCITSEKWGSYGTAVPLTGDCFIRMLEENEVPPTYVELLGSYGGAYTSMVSRSRGDDEVSFELYYKPPFHGFTTTAIYFRHRIRAGDTFCLVFGDAIGDLEVRLRSLLDSVYKESGPAIDPFLVLGAIASEQSGFLELKQRIFGTDLMNVEIKTGQSPFEFARDSSLIASIQELAMIKSSIHLLDARVAVLEVENRLQIGWLDFLLQQHQVLRDLQFKILQGKKDITVDAAVLASGALQGHLKMTRGFSSNRFHLIESQARRVKIQLDVVYPSFSIFRIRVRSQSLAEEVNKGVRAKYGYTFRSRVP
ncbi:MAG: hypothetical protein M1816_000976 [Peltula sp. TS41687]|nr:MAG: hypothetical protein M1816_000976 [Peltula sp. TS41687]